MPPRLSLAPLPSPPMDPGIWSHLPADLLEYVICFLPLKYVFNLRTISKHFKSLIFHPSFLSKYYSVSSPSDSSSPSSPFSSFLLLSHPQFRHHYLLYDTRQQNWRKFSVSLSLLFPNTNLLPCLISISNGLLCFSHPSSHSFLIRDHLSKYSRVVKFPHLPFRYEFLTLISTSDGFRIFLISTVSSSSSHSVVFLYDSRTESWSEIAGSRSSFLIDNYYQQGVYRNGWLYFTTVEPFSVVGFDVMTRRWGGSSCSGDGNPIDGAPLPNDLSFVRLVSGGDEGKLYMVGGIGRNGISRSLKLWELLVVEEGNENGGWVEVVTLPDLMFKKFVSVCYHNYEHVYCFWHQGLICICCYNWPEVLYYKVGRRTWHWLRKCPDLHEKWSCGFRWFSFVPQLSAAA